ncbi:hypothetical protein AWV79_36075 [Cupriavidus sp. UYMMa02A]|nr:hypothetical protein AWV79_36075 [Cupriavidus sp. UYMMa02A]
MAWHRLVLRDRQNLHWRHSGVYSGITWSPGLSEVTPGPDRKVGGRTRSFGDRGARDGARSFGNREGGGFGGQRNGNGNSRSRYER